MPAEPQQSSGRSWGPARAPGPGQQLPRLLAHALAVAEMARIVVGGAGQRARGVAVRPTSPRNSLISRHFAANASPSGVPSRWPYSFIAQPQPAELLMTTSALGERGDVGPREFAGARRAGRRAPAERRSSAGRGTSTSKPFCEQHLQGRAVDAAEHWLHHAAGEQRHRARRGARRRRAACAGRSAAGAVRAFGTGGAMRAIAAAAGAGASRASAGRAARRAQHREERPQRADGARPRATAGSA
jgi:hypothetical protein